tara:strand:- start:884 stop:1603 length:720 start_codon:yes stop_codon:yes gene_type:complete
MSKGIEKQVGDWYPLLEPILSSSYFNSLTTTIKKGKAEGRIIYPDTKLTFRAFKLCQLKDLKVVILGQDPYHDGSATGLAFANSGDGPRISPSLAWIKKALEHDYDTLCLDFDYGLTSWADQGVLLLNTALTVEKGKAGSHTVLWNTFTKELLNYLTNTKDDIIFVLWGKKAQDYAKFIKGNNKIVTAPHPAADAYTGGSAGFHTSGTFRAINDFLDIPIKWNTHCGEPLPLERSEAPF